MNFTPLSDEELNAQKGLLAPGVADFEVVEAKDEVSKSSGNEMIKLNLKVWDSQGKQGMVFDYLVSTVSWKIKQFFDAIGKPEIYNVGTITSQNLIGASGKATLGIQKDRTGKYGDQTKVVEYIKAGTNLDSILPDDEDPFK